MSSLIAPAAIAVQALVSTFVVGFSVARYAGLVREDLGFMRCGILLALFLAAWAAQRWADTQG